MQAYGKVGKKGTLYPPKKLLEKLELKEGDMIQYTAQGNNLLVVKICDPLKVASEFNIPFNAKKATQIISEIGKESEKEIEEEIQKTPQRPRSNRKSIQKPNTPKLTTQTTHKQQTPSSTLHDAY